MLLAHAVAYMRRIRGSLYGPMTVYVAYRLRPSSRTFTFICKVCCVFQRRMVTFIQRKTDLSWKEVYSKLWNKIPNVLAKVSLLEIKSIEEFKESFIQLWSRLATSLCKRKTAIKRKGIAFVIKSIQALAGLEPPGRVKEGVRIRGLEEKWEQFISLKPRPLVLFYFFCAD